MLGAEFYRLGNRLTGGSFGRLPILPIFSKFATEIEHPKSIAALVAALPISFLDNFPLDQKNSTFAYMFADTGREGKIDYPENNANDGYGEPKHI